MKKMTIWLSLTALYLIVHCVFVRAMVAQPVSVVLQKLKAEGYIAVKKIKLVDDEYQVNAINNLGETADILINSYTGELISMKKIEPHISMFEIVEKVEAVGYGNITAIEAKNNDYEIMAVDRVGKETQLRVDAITGKVTKAP